MAVFRPTELRGLHVLVVDDNATNRRIFEAYVTAWGMRPKRRARTRLTRSLNFSAPRRKGDPYDVALLDFHMPDENGLELARRITASPTLRHTRLILLTSSGQVEADDPTSGIRCRLTKPVRQSRLLDAISCGDGGRQRRKGVHDESRSRSDQNAPAAAPGLAAGSSSRRTSTSTGCCSSAS